MTNFDNMTTAETLEFFNDQIKDIYENSKIEKGSSLINYLTRNEETNKDD